MQGKDTLEKRFNNLDKSEVLTLPVGSYVNFVSASEAEKLTLGIIATHVLTIKGLTQDFQVGVEAGLLSVLISRAKWENCCNLKFS